MTDYTPSEKVKKARQGNFSPVNKSLNASQEEIQTQLYGGDIYLLGGSHFIMKENDNSGGDDVSNTAGQNYQLAALNLEAELNSSSIPNKAGQLSRQISQMKKRTNGRSRKRVMKNAKQLQKIAEPEEEESSPQGGADFAS